MKSFAEYLEERIGVGKKTKFQGKKFNAKKEIASVKKIIVAVNKLAKDMDSWQYPGSVHGPSKILDKLADCERECYDHILQIERGKFDGPDGIVDVED
tara:strand:- start:1204 stop:1497 length:294 start_codon:yes stop_codon:yes gene_type:complete